VLAWLLVGLNVFLSSSISVLALEAIEAADRLWVRRSPASVSRLGRFGLVLRVDILQERGAGEKVRFRFSDASCFGVDGGDRVLRCSNGAT
jgi:hypothetical protein